MTQLLERTPHRKAQQSCKTTAIEAYRNISLPNKKKITTPNNVKEYPEKIPLIRHLLVQQANQYGRSKGSIILSCTNCYCILVYIRTFINVLGRLNLP